LPLLIKIPFFAAKPVPKLCEIFGFQLARKLKEAGIKKVDWVIGSSYAAITFSHEVAKAFGAIHAFPEKDPSDPDGKKMIWRRMQIPKDAIVLQAEELITTSDTFREVRRAVKQGNYESVNWLPVVGTLVHRPPKLPVNYDGIEIVSLIEVEVWAVDQKDCPLCAIGSPRYRPKANWAKLTGKA
jgi:orotate phosphoribosyltransferase